MRAITRNVEDIARPGAITDRVAVDDGEFIALARLGDLHAFTEIWKQTLLTMPRCPTHLPAWAEATLASVTPFRPFQILLGIGSQGLEFILPLTFRRYRLFGRPAMHVEAATELSPFYCRNTKYWLPRLFNWL